MNLADDLAERAGRHPSRAALTGEAGTLSYEELEERVRRVAAGFARMGLASGARVGLLLPNAPSFVECLYGAWRAGLVVVPLNTGYTRAEVQRIVAAARASALVADGASMEVAQDVQDVQDLRVTVPEELRGTEADGPPTASQPGQDPTAVLAFTAGTTGRPKGVVLTHGNLRANHAQLSGSRQQVEADDTVLAVLPLFHIYGLNVALGYTLAAGGTALLMDRFTQAGSLRAIAEHEVTVVPAVPPMFRAWLAADEGVADFSRVRVVASGGARLDPALAEAFAGRFGKGVWEGYGLTETSPVVTSTAMGETPLPGSIGRPLPGVSIRLRDEAGRPVAGGDPGEIQVRGPNVFGGYWEDPEATAAAFTSDGWFRTGDVAYAREGDLYLVDRRDDLVIVSGFNVYPREVEDVLLTHPAVDAVAVVGVPDERTGEAVKAVVVLRPGTEVAPEDLVAHCRESLARFKCPSAVEVVEELPVLPMGKVLRRELRER